MAPPGYARTSRPPPMAMGLQYALTELDSLPGLCTYLYTDVTQGFKMSLKDVTS